MLRADKIYLYLELSYLNVLFSSIISVVSGRGWPFVCFMWGILDFALLWGSSPFVHHWLHWQEFLPIFNESNPGYGSDVLMLLVACVSG